MPDYHDYFEVITSLDTFEDKHLRDAEDIFEKYKLLAVIDKNAEFEDNDWITTNETSNTGFHFTFSKGTYDKYYKELFDMDLDQFVVYVKSFVCLMLGKVALVTLASFVTDIKKLISTPLPSIEDHDNVLKISSGNIVKDFLLVLPCETSSLAESVEYYADASYGKSFRQRTLADFESYFLFNDIMDDYWKSALSDRDRMFFYPLYLWWKLTGALPQRPCEFLLIPRSCITQNVEGEYLMDIRQNRIKGRSQYKTIGYKVAHDYWSGTIKIPIELGLEIQNYISKTTDCEGTRLDTLFVQDPHYNYFGKTKTKNNLGYLTYSNLNTILKRFYKDVISDIYGFSIIYKKPSGQRLDDKEICFVHLGDTRHIAMINILIEGGSPLTAMALAGHASIYMSGHYFTNIRNLIECRAYYEYTRISGETASYSLTPKKRDIPRTEGIELMDGGSCYSEHFSNDDYTDCINAIGPNGEIGYCPVCTHHRKKGIGFYSNDEVYLRNLEDDCRELENAVSRSRNGDMKGLGKALLKVQSSSLSYEAYLKEKNNAKNKDN